MRVPGTGYKDFPILQTHSVNSPAMINDPFCTLSPSPLFYEVISLLRTRLLCLQSHISSYTIYTVYIVNGVALNCLQSKPIALRCDEGIDCAIPSSYLSTQDTIYDMFVVINISISLPGRFAQSVRRLKTSMRCVETSGAFSYQSKRVIIISRGFQVELGKFNDLGL